MVTTTLVRSVVARARPTLSGPSGKRVELGDALVTIGRHEECELPLPDDQASRRHARVVPTDAGYLLEDLGSTNGTFVNGERVAEPRLLSDGDRIEIGHSVVRFGHTFPA
jgi:pSer/pThr/pTyr-binding forkhead associated (FHA) protein